MYNYFDVIRTWTLVAVSLFLFTGCEKQSAPPTTKTVISKKIDMPEKKAAPAAEPGKKAETVMPDKTATPGKADVATSKTVKPETVETGITIETAALPKSLAAVYDPTGKIDPFENVFKKRELAEASGENQAKKRKRVPSTPLEQIALSQLKLVAVMVAPSGSRAMVEEASGKGYIIQNGTYVGTNSGRVIDILLDKIVIEEEVEDILGKLVVRKSEMTLQKAPGE